jgi:leucyl aminopeptidase
MPLYPEYVKALKSTIADMKNSSTGRKASPCMGAIFLQQFIEKKTSWAHLDIAGTAYLSESNPYYPSFATGVGVKLVLSFVENL